MKYFIVRNENTPQITVVYRDNQMRMCRQTFAAWRSRKDPTALAVVMWEDAEPGDEVAVVGSVSNEFEAAALLNKSLQAFLKFVEKKLREELQQPIVIPPTMQEAMLRLNTANVPGVAWSHPLQPTAQPTSSGLPLILLGDVNKPNLHNP